MATRVAAPPTAVAASAALAPGSLPEQASVRWRRRVGTAELGRRGRWWTLTTISHTVPFVLAAGLVVAMKPLLVPIAIVLLIHAWAIPELYAARGAGVLKPSPGASPGAGAGRSPGAGAGPGDPEKRALRLLGDLVDHGNRKLHDRTGLVLQPGVFGNWIVGEAGAVLVGPGGRRVFCYCVGVTDKRLPAGDRIAHLLLALRCDEAGFATVANLAFSGASWRLRRRLRPEQREALELARRHAAR
jgi:hypothetical protein